MSQAREPDPIWRQEFPLRAEEERYVTRRQFSRFLVLTSLGMFAGNIWIFARSLLRRRPVLPAAAVARASEVPIGGVKLFTYPGPHDPCILVRTSEERFVAYSQKCTHLSCAVFLSPEKDRLECPCHKGYFALEDGRVLQGPPPRPLPRIALQQRGDDLVAVAVETQEQA
jgi:Rieske Fe-S protein